MITLFWCPRTRASRILWLLEELGEPFELRLVDIRQPEAREDPDFRAASPMGKVPALMDETPEGVVRVADSAASRAASMRCVTLSQLYLCCT